MSDRKQGVPPEDRQKITAHARERLRCDDCKAEPGQPCTGTGSGRVVCRSRYITAAIAVRRQANAERRTTEQDAQHAAIIAELKALPRIGQEEIEACKTENGGYRFTKKQLAAWGVPWPPPAGWRSAIQDPRASEPGRTTS